MEPVASFASSAIGCKINSKSSKLYPKACCLFFNSFPIKNGFSSLIIIFLSRSIIWLLKCLYSLAKKFFILSFLNNFPFSILTPIISPGPNLPFAIIFCSARLIIPVSEPANKNLSFVMVNLIGLSPFLSVAAITHSLSVAAIAAGPSHGSIVLFKKLNNR